MTKLLEKLSSIPSTSFQKLSDHMSTSIRAPAQWVQNRIPSFSRPSTSSCFPNFPSTSALCCAKAGFFGKRKRPSLSVQPQGEQNTIQPGQQILTEQQRKQSAQAKRRMSGFQEIKPKSDEYESDDGDPLFTVSDKVMPRRLPPLRPQQFTGKVELTKKIHKPTKSSTVVMAF